MQKQATERFNTSHYLTTTEVGALLDVHPSTVKRWCDGGDVFYRTTEGGHRRLHLRDALDLAKAKQISTHLDGFSPYEAHVWSAFRAALTDGRFERLRSLGLGWLLRGRWDHLSRLIHTVSRRKEIPHPVFLDSFLHGFMADVGTAWEEGRLPVGAEHEVSQIVDDCLRGLLEERRRARSSAPSDSPADSGSDSVEKALERRVAVVGCQEGNRHTLGSLSIRLVLEDRGWKVIYLGEDIPLEELAETQVRREAELVCVSLSPLDGPAGVHRAIRVLSALYRSDHPYTLVLGGDGLGDMDLSRADDSPFLDLRLFTRAGDFHDWLKEAA